MSIFIDLDNIKNNILVITKTLNKDLMVVLKDNAYELNTKKIIPILKKTKVKWVVYNKFEEYLIDKDYLSGFKVLILESPCDKYLNLPIIYSVNSLNDAYLILKSNVKTVVHLQVDTGMNRVGIRNEKEFMDIIKIFLTNNNILIDGIYTHFSSDIDEYDYYQKQLNNFKKYLNLYSFNNVHSVSTHSLHKEITGNMVRVGMAIYGYESKLQGLLPSISYYTKPVNSFLLNKGECVGYFQMYKAKKQTYITVLPIGYDDIIGINEIRQKKEKYKIVGKICMNHLFIKSNKKINYLTSLNVLSKNDIISYRNYNWYLIITSMKKIPKNYIRRSDYDISKVFTKSREESRKYRFRKRSN